jgi:predicted nucleic acid-binding protein
MKQCFWDTNLFIYLLENNPNFGSQVLHLDQLMQKQQLLLVTSYLTYGELLVYPNRQQEQHLLQLYHKLFRSSRLTLLPFKLETAECFAGIRNQGVKAPDAYQLACAAEAQTFLFVTHDKDLTRLSIPGISHIMMLENAIELLTAKGTL